MKKRLNIIYKFINKFIQPIRAFTLLELIVVITILSILGSIAFFSVNWFIKKARDISRLENLNIIDFWIELFVTEKWYYPEPDNASEIVFSGWLLWSQGTFWDSTRTKVWKINTKPVDLVSLNEFTYSLANDKKQYELWAVFEANEMLLDNFSFDTYAKSQILVKSMVVWNYNGLTLSVNTGWLVYILGLPTILSYDVEEKDIVNLISKKTLAYKWFWNIAASYTWTLFKIDWWFDFDPSLLVLFTWTYDTLLNNESEWINLLNNLQLAYSWTILAWATDLQQIMSVNIDVLNPSKIVRELAYDLVANQLNIQLPITLTSWANWITYDMTNSLLDSDTRSITQDSALNMWFATKNWISTFIWNTWWSYSEADWLINKDVRTVLEASNWDMLFATNKWISIFDGTTWIDYNKTDWLIDDDVVDLIQDSSWNFWFATKKWVSKFDGNIWTNYDTKDWVANKIVTWITEWLWWDIWISTIDWVSKFNWTTWISYNESDWLSDKNVLSIYTDALWNIWFWTINWVSKFNWTTWINYNESDWLINKYINDIYMDADLNMRFATSAWASMFDWINWISYTIVDWLADNDVQVIYQDVNLNMWFGTKKWVTIYFK